MPVRFGESMARRLTYEEESGKKGNEIPSFFFLVYEGQGFE